MTPARLEEVERWLRGARSVPVTDVGLALLAEVKRLREVLDLIDDRGDECHRHCGTCACGQWCSRKAADTLRGEEPTP